MSISPICGKNRALSIILKLQSELSRTESRAIQPVGPAIEYLHSLQIVLYYYCAALMRLIFENLQWQSEMGRGK
jgi:hypothetical protein